MKTCVKQQDEDFWIQAVIGAADEGAGLICVPLHALPRAWALKLATKLDLTVFVKGSNYLFSMDIETTKAMLKEEDTLH